MPKLVSKSSFVLVLDRGVCFDRGYGNCVHALASTFRVLPKNSLASLGEHQAESVIVVAAVLVAYALRSKLNDSLHPF